MDKLRIFGGQAIILTGGIASGKSFVMAYMKSLGFALFASDEAIHSLMLPGAAAYKQVSALVPSALRDGIIDRTLLSEEVFSKPGILERLEAVLHPLLDEYRTSWLISMRAKSNRSVIIETPLFFEKNLNIPHHAVWCTICPLSLQRQRALLRPNMSAEKFDHIINSQVDNARRKRESDCLIDTSRSKLNTTRQVDALINL